MRRFVVIVWSAWLAVWCVRPAFAQDRPRLDFLPDANALAPPPPMNTEIVPQLPRVVLPEEIPGAPREIVQQPVVPVLGPRSWSLAEMAPLRPWDPVGAAVEPMEVDRTRFVPRTWQEWLVDYRDEATETVFRSREDFRNFYTTPNLLCVGIAVIAAAPVANSHADTGIRDWWQGHVRNDRSDSFFTFGNDQLGDWRWTGGVLIGGAVVGKILEDYPAGTTLRTFSTKSLRALIVGAPAVGVLQYGLGGDRPPDGSSYWQPIRTHEAVSGHAYVGAVPFLTAAYMTDSYALKALFVAGSLYTPVARINDDRNYFSQAALGYVIAVVATHSVFQTDMEHSRIHLAPLPMQDAVGLSVMMKY
jgi:hypothetical protein